MIKLPQSERMQNNQLLDKTPVSLKSVVQKYGFLPASSTQKIQQIKKFHPEGQTRLYDSIVVNCKSLIKINQEIKTTTGLNYQNLKFYFIVVCDGHDTDSNNTFLNAKQSLLQLKNLFVDPNKFNYYTIGINLDERGLQDLLNLAKYIGKQNTFQNINFEQIQQTIGKIKQDCSKVQSYQDQIRVICFTLDPSGSMLGRRWRHVCKAIQQVRQILKNKDFLKIVTFNQNLGYSVINDRLYVEENPQIIAPKVQIQEINIAPLMYEYVQRNIDCSTDRFKCRVIMVLITLVLLVIIIIYFTYHSN